MSWPQWGTAPMPPASSVSTGAAVPPAPGAIGATTGVAYTATVQAPASYTPAQYAALPPEQQLALQQNWQQWQTYHQQYAQWHAQYGEQYQREMQAKLGIAAPSIPFVPTLAPYVAPVPPAGASNYSIPPPPPTQTTSVMHNPSICAVTANPPPPPPPPPPQESNEKNDSNEEDSFSRRQELSGNNNYGQQNNQRNQFGQNQRNQQQKSWRSNNDRGFNDRRGGGGYGNDRGRDRDNFGDNINSRGGGRGRDRGRDRDRDGDRGRFENDRGGRNLWQQNSQNQNMNFGGNSRQDCFPNQQMDRQDCFPNQQMDRQDCFPNQQMDRQDCFPNQQMDREDRFSNQQMDRQDRFQNQQMERQERFQNQQKDRQDCFPNQQMDQPQPEGQNDDDKTPEERAFDEQFKKWEEEFENWKRQNANHPDKKAYKEYEMKFEDCRRKLLERREVMRKRKIERKLKEEQQRAALAPPILPVIDDPAIEEKSQPEPPPDEPEKPMEVAAPPEPDASAENNQAENVFLANTKSDGIPGLDLVGTNETVAVEKTGKAAEIIDLGNVAKAENAEPNLAACPPGQPPGPLVTASDFISSMPPAGPPGQLPDFTSMPPVGPMGLVPDYVNTMPPTGPLGLVPDFTTMPPIGPLAKKEIPSLMSQKFDMPEMSPPRGKPDSDNLNDDCNHMEINRNFSNQNESNETFGKFLENRILSSDQRGSNESDNYGNHPGEQENMPRGISNLANALSDPNVLALITAAIGNSGAPAGSGNFNPDIDRRGGPGVSPWMSGQEPFQNQFNKHRDFGGNHSNVGGWQDNQSRYNNSPWGNRQDTRWGNQGQNNSMRQDDYRRGNSRWQDDGDNWRNSPWGGDDKGLDRNNAPPSLVDERSRSSERVSDKDKVNPFKDQDDRGSGRFNPFAGADRGRRFNRDDQGNRSRSNNSGNSRDRSRSSGRSSRHDGSTTSSNRRNPFKTEANAFDKPLNSPFPHGEPPQNMNEPYFRPTRVIDYQNRPLGMESENNEVLLPTKVVDYGHGGGTADGPEERNDFLPMTTIDYGHASARTENQNSIQNLNPNQIQNQNQNQNQGFNEGRKNEFNSNRRRNRNRRNRRSGLQENFSTRSDPWLGAVPVLPSFFGNREESNNNELSLNPENDVNIPPEHDANEKHENLDEISEDDNDFGESEFTQTFVNEEFQIGTAPDPVVENQKPAAVFPINEDAPSTIVEKKVQLIASGKTKNAVSIEEILFTPERQSRPKKIVIVVRGPPGSGKSYVAKLIKEKEIEMGGSAPRILSIDDYFMTEVDKAEKCPKTGKKVTIKEMVYEYEKEMEESYMGYLLKSYKKTVNDNLFDFVIVDCVNNTLKTITEFYEISKDAQFTFYVIDLLCDLETCLSQNIHNRSMEDIKQILENWEILPDWYVQLDITSILQSDAIQEVEMEDVSFEGYESPEGNEIYEEEQVGGFVETVDFFKSKWDTDAKEDQLARLDGISRPLQKSMTTLEDYLQMDGGEPPPSSSSNKKRVRWADIEEKRAQDKMRAIGFVVGQTDWSRMMDPTGGSAALTKTKYIEKVNRKN